MEQPSTPTPVRSYAREIIYSQKEALNPTSTGFD
jgi:hypothetical protein